MRLKPCGHGLPSGGRLNVRHRRSIIPSSSGLAAYSVLLLLPHLATAATLSISRPIFV